MDNLIERGLDPTVCRLFIIDGRQGDVYHQHLLWLMRFIRQGTRAVLPRVHLNKND
jgi:hypothetical protein